MLINKNNFLTIMTTAKELDFNKRITEFYSQHKYIMNHAPRSRFQNTLAADLFTWASYRLDWDSDAEAIENFEISPIVIDSIYSLDEQVDYFEDLFISSGAFKQQALDSINQIIRYLESTAVLDQFATYKSNVLRQNKLSDNKLLARKLIPENKKKYNEMNCFSNKRNTYLKSGTNFKKMVFSRHLPPTAFFEGGEAHTYSLAKELFGEKEINKYFQDF